MKRIAGVLAVGLLIATTAWGGPRQLKGKVVRVEAPYALLILDYQGKRTAVECDDVQGDLANIKPGMQVEVNVKQWLLPLKCVADGLRAVELKDLEYTRPGPVRVEGLVEWMDVGRQAIKLRRDHREVYVPSQATIMSGAFRGSFYSLGSGAYVQVSGWAISPTEIVARHINVLSGARN